MKARTYNQNNTNTNNPKQETPAIVVSSFSVKRATTKRGTVMADVEINGILIYGFSVLANKENGEAFLGWPGTKGSDNKYYKTCWARLSDSDQEAIITSIYDYLDKNT